MSSMSDPLGAVTSYRYSDAGNLLGTHDALGRATAFEYDSMGNRTAEVQPDRTVVRYAYGGLNWLYRITNTDGTQVNIRHNREGWPVYIENERAERHSFTYYPDGAVSAEIDFLGRETRYTYDGLGRALTIERERGARQMKYSRAGLLLEEIEFDGSTRRFEYNARGEVTRANNGDVDLVFERDGVGNIIKESCFFNNQEYSVASSRSSSGDRTKYSSSLGANVYVSRDANGRVAALDANGTRVLEVKRDPRGLATKMLLADGGAISSQYDAARRLVHRTASTADGSPSDAAELGFEYTAIDEVSRVDGLADGSVLLEYDVRRQVVRRSAAQGTVEEFQYSSSSEIHETSAGAPARQYDRGGRLQVRGDTTFTYDDLGNLAERRERGSSEHPRSTVYNWNAWGFLQSIERNTHKVEFVYDAFARRVAKVTTVDSRVSERQRFVWDRLSMLHHVREDDAGVPREYRTYLYEDNDDVSPVGHQAEDGRWYYYLQDINLFPAHVIDAYGRIAGSTQRSTYGRTAFRGAPSADTPFRLPGQFEDAETGLHYNRYRYYDPEAGGFISPDPLGLLGGLRPHGYAPNPIAWSDPMGWYHVMTILEAPANFAPTHAHPYVRGDDDRYRSGYTGTPCQDDLCSNSGCHTEQKFCADLLAQHRADGGEPFRDENFRLKGKLPPCPACHASMMQAASETGANIKYEWDNPAGTTHSVTYDGSSNSGHSAQNRGVTVSGSGHGADLVGGYTHTPSGTNAGPPQPGVPTAAYGYDYAGSYNTYYDVANR
jgi:RHS repeat-associated protein